MVFVATIPVVLYTPRGYRPAKVRSLTGTVLQEHVGVVQEKQLELLDLESQLNLAASLLPSSF